MNKETCCTKFDPEAWDEKEITWENKKFVQDRVCSFLHIPLNFGQVMKRIMKKIDAAGVSHEDIVLSDEDSLWGANVFVPVSSDIDGAKMTTISGTFLCKVFEGPYKNMRNWMHEMDTFVKSKGNQEQMRYFYYTTCPKCAKKYGKNYVVLLAKIFYEF